MKQPVWTLELLRDTNAPLDKVLDRLGDGPGWSQWHPVPRPVALQQEPLAEGAAFRVTHPRRWGVLEEERMTATRDGERVLLAYTARFKGWPALLLMGWWRYQRGRLWERFVDGLR